VARRERWPENGANVVKTFGALWKKVYVMKYVAMYVYVGR
jgi:hypothetical protein